MELGRGEDYAWSATSAGSDLIDQRLELVCNPERRKPTATEAYYKYKGNCVAMKHETFTESADHQARRNRGAGHDHTTRST